LNGTREWNKTLPIFLKEDFIMLRVNHPHPSQMSFQPINGVYLTDQVYFFPTSKTVTILIEGQALTLFLNNGTLSINEGRYQRITQLGNLMIDYHWTGEVSNIGNLTLGYSGSKVTTIGDIMIERDCWSDEISEIKQNDRVLFKRESSECTIL
jgi:hypothetical protein